MSVHISGYFPALIIGEASVAAGYSLQHFMEPYLRKYPNYQQIGKIVINLAGSVAAACLLGSLASVPLSVAITVNFIAHAVFYVIRELPNDRVTRKDLIQFAKNMRDIPHMTTQLKVVPHDPEPYELLSQSIDSYSGSDDDSDVVLMPE